MTKSNPCLRPRPDSARQHSDGAAPGRNRTNCRPSARVQALQDIFFAAEIV